MKIRNKILFYFSTTVILVSAISLAIVFILFAAYREEEFQQQQFSKIKYTVGLIEEFERISAEVSLLLDKQDIHDFYDEKMLIYDQHKQLVFSSIDSLNILQADSILHQLSVTNTWIETKEEGYDLIGVYIENNDNSYYAISKAYDYFGYSKRDFLQKVLIGIFIAITIIVLLISLYLSNIISKPLTELTKKIEAYDLSEENEKPLKLDTTTRELQNLSEKFNELIRRTNEAFLFQKNSIQHISHELKTPIAVLVSEMEKLQHENDIEKIKKELQQQTRKAQSLGGIIEILLHISKIESGQATTKDWVRIDEIIFDCISEINILYPDFYVEITFKPETFDEKILRMKANESLLKQAFQNLLLNAVHYSDNQKVKITFTEHFNKLNISLSNTGKTLSKSEEKYLFSHFFRGENAQNQKGFGIGLVLAQRIFNIHQAEILYESKNRTENIFKVRFK